MGNDCCAERDKTTGSRVKSEKGRLDAAVKLKQIRDTMNQLTEVLYNPQDKAV